MSRYEVTGSEGDYEPGSEETVLANKAGITDADDMNIAETELLGDLYEYVFDHFPERLDWSLLCEWHRKWLGNLYEWAGRFRTVDMSKPDIRFASPLQISKLAKQFEADYLERFDELSEMDDDELAAFLAEAHVEFILIHPFREGNGRMSRLLLDVMAINAGLQPLDYQLWDTHKDFYFKAIQAGRDGDCQYIERLVRDVLEGNGGEPEE